MKLYEWPVLLYTLISPLDSSVRKNYSRDIEEDFFFPL